MKCAPGCVKSVLPFPSWVLRYNVANFCCGPLHSTSKRLAIFLHFSFNFGIPQQMLHVMHVASSASVINIILAKA